MASFYLTNAAKTDLKEIGRYTKKQWGAAERDKYLTAGRLFSGFSRSTPQRPGL